MIKISIRSQYNRAKTLSGGKHLLVFISKVPDLVNEDRFMPEILQHSGRTAGEILVDKKLHYQRQSSYGDSSKLARRPANSNTADRSSDETLG